MIMLPNILQIIIEVLRQTKNKSELPVNSSLKKELLEYLGLEYTNGNSIFIDRTHRIALAKKAVEYGASIGDVVELLTWKDFEGFIAAILAENHFECVESFRRRGNSLIHGMEIDVIGVRGGTIIAIDAKMWGVRSSKTSALKKAADEQKKRTAELERELNRLSKKLGKLETREYQLIPVIVTWLVEEVELHEGVPVVPVFKFNSFILDLHQYDDLIVSYSGHHHSPSI
jgi:hypothetical protein